MPSYLQLAQEQVWQDQYVPDNLTTLLIEPLREFYNMGAAAIGAPGDNNHLYGRHRSADWDRTSAFCTNRSYGTTDARDHSGDQDIYRAVDVGIQGETLYAASHRMDELVRSGKCPGVAEWFGTFDGQTVVGWYEGHPSSSDDSHLWHLHVGFWNGSADDPETMRLVLAAITGQSSEEGADMDTEQARQLYNLDRLNTALLLDADEVTQLDDGQGNKVSYPLMIVRRQKAILKALAEGVTVEAEVDLTDAAVEKVAKATADEIAADPERDGADT